jgi:Ca2+:H+ antiporter
MAGSVGDKVAVWSLALPVAAAAVLAAKASGLVGVGQWPGFVLAALLLGGTVFSAVHHAEVLALKVGEPFGSILLAVSVTVIEVALIVSILMTGEPGSGEVARDTVYATVLIVLNGIVGLCLVAGGLKHRVQTFSIDGAAATLAVLGTLATFALIMPNFTEATGGPTYAPVQLLIVGLSSLVLYCVFIFVQTILHREYFLEAGRADEPPATVPTGLVTLLSAVFLIAALVAVVLLAKVLSKPLEVKILSMGLPRAFLGVLIAAVVLLPEGIAAFRAALANQLQVSANLALGSAVASIGLTIPVVAVVSLVLDVPLVLGLSEEGTALLVLTLFTSILTFATGRTTILQGAVHLVIFAVFLLLSAVP